MSQDGTIVIDGTEVPIENLTEHQKGLVLSIQRLDRELAHSAALSSAIEKARQSAFNELRFDLAPIERRKSPWNFFTGGR